MLPLLGAIIGAGASLIGGSMNNRSQEKANAANNAAAAEASQKNYEAQKEFAQQGLRWKVADAEAAGVHPLYALGAQGQSFAPSFVGATSESGRPGDGIASAGQEIGRAVSSTLTQPEKAYNQTVQQLSLERAGLENELLRSQIRRTNVGTIASGTPLSGGANPASLMYHGLSWDKNPQTSDAQDIEDRYGDLVAALYGAGVIGSDVLYNAPSSSGSNAGPTVKRFNYARWSAEQRLKAYLTDGQKDVPADPYRGIY